MAKIPSAIAAARRAASAERMHRQQRELERRKRAEGQQRLAIAVASIVDEAFKGHEQANAILSADEATLLRDCGFTVNGRISTSTRMRGTALELRAFLVENPFVRVHFKQSIDFTWLDKYDFTSARVVLGYLDDLIANIETEEVTEQPTLQLKLHLAHFAAIAKSLRANWIRHDQTLILREVNLRPWSVGPNEKSTISWESYQDEGDSDATEMQTGDQEVNLEDQISLGLVTGPNMGWLCNADGQNFTRRLGDAIREHVKAGKYRLMIKVGKENREVRIGSAAPLRTPFGASDLALFLNTALGTLGYETSCQRNVVTVSWRNVNANTTR